MLVHRRPNRNPIGGFFLLAAFTIACSGSPTQGWAATEDGVSPFYAKKSTWAETLCASRERYTRWYTEQLGGVTLGPWYTTGRGDTFSPVETFDLKTLEDNGWTPRYDLLDGRTHCDLSNHGISEQRRLPSSDAEDPASCDRTPEPAQHIAADVGDSDGPGQLYQVRVIRAAKPVTLTARLGAEYGLAVWLNGRLVFSNATMGNGLYPVPDRARVALPLVAGKNRLVLKSLGHRWGGFSFSLLSSKQTDPAPLDVLLKNIEQDFPVATRRMRADLHDGRVESWFRNPDRIALPNLLAERAIDGLGESSRPLQEELRQIGRVESPESQRECLNLYARVAAFRKAWTDLRGVDFDAMGRAIRDLEATFPATYPHADDLLRRLDAYRQNLPELEQSLHRGEDAALGRVGRIVAFQRKTLLSNPLLDFDRLLVIRRKPIGDARRAKGPSRGMGEFLGLPQQSAWQLDRIRQPYGWENEIALLSDLRSNARLTTVYRPPTPRLISDIELRFDARKISFSMPGSHYLWQIFEMEADGTAARQITPTDQPDVHNFDGCYLPNGQMAFISTAPLQGVPCSNGIAVAMTYLMDADGTNIRRLCFDQDHNHCPTVMNDGRILYLRWDYTDLPHQWPRILMTMNPDGSGQREYYGSNSYWPNAIFFARPVPNHRTKIVGIVTGHHVGRVGELIVFDPAVGRQEADGVVQRIPGYGQPVEPIIMDKLTIDSWPKFSHPYPLSENYFIVSAKPSPDALWGIYLVDTFDNMVLLKEVEGEVLFEPIPFRPTPTPPVIPSRIDLTQSDAVLYIGDIYAGKGMRGVPRGTVERLRVLTYSFAYPYKSGGQHRVGTDGPWEPKRVLGTVAVEDDGSAMFRVPANMPISIQPLDAQGKAVQLMRSWTTAMPGELVSCVGCHEDQNSVPPARVTKAAMRAPSQIEPWHGPARGFSFAREVQPVLDRHCVGCHDGRPRDDGTTLCDLRREQGRYVCISSGDPKPVVVEGVGRDELARRYSGVFEPAFFALRRFVRVGGLESDLHVLPPCEFHADTSELFQMLGKGHHGVELDDEAWRRLATWVDLNAPCYGTWREVLGVDRTAEEHGRRLELRMLYGGAEDLETTVEVGYRPVVPNDPNVIESARVEVPVETSVEIPTARGWPFDAAQARQRQKAAGQGRTSRTIRLGGDVSLEMTLVPAGQFVMGSADGPADERPMTRATIDQPFWMGRFEVTNEQFALFDASHDSRHEHGTASFNSERATGPKVNRPKQPVVRISWQEATAFCRWMSEKIGHEVTLPTEAQWEYACRAGSAGPFSFGDLDTDFSPFANLADATINGWATYNERRRSADQVPRDTRFDDGALVTADVGQYDPNPWGLHDMHGNAWEWTRSQYRAYPHAAAFDADDGRDPIEASARRTVRGGSWYDRPKRARSAFRLSYPAWQKVYNVGFRVVCAVEPM